MPLLTFKALNIVPDSLCSKIQITLEEQLNPGISSSNTKFGRRTFSYRASKLWKDLPIELMYINKNKKPLYP